jgi:hypothetical protein
MYTKVSVPFELQSRNRRKQQQQTHRTTFPSFIEKQQWQRRRRRRQKYIVGCIRKRNHVTLCPLIQLFNVTSLMPALVHVCTELYGRQVSVRPNQVRSLRAYCLELRDQKRRLFVRLLLCGDKTELDGEHLSCLEV